MSFKRLMIPRAVLPGLILLLITGWSHAQSSSGQKTPRKIQGEPISAINPAQGSNAPAAPKVSGTISTSQPTPGTVPAPGGGPKTANPITEVSFDELASYEFATPDAAITNLAIAVSNANKQIPAAIKLYDGKKLSITGFMLPTKTEKGEVTEFLLLRNQSMCCFGVTPKITEWVTVRLAGEGLETAVMDQPVTVKGTLHIGAVVEDSAIVEVYQMDEARMVEY
jgi:hypothetical protein